LRKEFDFIFGSPFSRLFHFINFTSQRSNIPYPHGQSV
jgi:hypothetical protein